MSSPWRMALALRTTRIALIIASLLGLALCLVQLTGLWGAESALILGVALPPFTAAIGARLMVALRRAEHAIDALQVIYLAAGVAGLVLAIPVTMLAINALRVKNCAPLEGLTFILLGPGFGVVLAALVGLFFTATLPWPRISTLCAIAVPLGAVGLSAYRLYTTPALFAYGQFFGYFNGSFYDDELSVPEALLYLRAITSCWTIGLGALFCAFFDGERLRLLGWRKRSPSVRSLLWATVTLSVGTITSFNAERLGLSTSVSKIVSELGGRAEGTRCSLIYPREIDRVEALRLSEECDFRVDQVEHWLGVRQRDRITAFLFRSPESKRELTGAAFVNTAKPWLNHVYLLAAPWPHPIIAHEIAHVVAKNAARGPFGVGGIWCGWWPHATIIEGIAVASAWTADDGMTPHQWARAMLESGLAPPLRKVMGINFLGQPKAQAYTLAGSLIRYIKEQYGAEVLRRIYASGSVETALNMPLEKLQAQWRAYVITIPLSAEARELARVRFSRKSIFTETCPHQMAILREQVRQELAANNPNQAAQTCQAILKVSTDDNTTRVALIRALAKKGDLEPARRELKRLIENGRIPQPIIAKAQVALGDAEWRIGSVNDALSLYQSALDLPHSKEAKRILEVKMLALEATGRQQALLSELLVDKDGQENDAAFAVYIARELRNYRQDGLPHYFEARQLFFDRHYQQAASLLAQARILGLPTPLLTLEATRLEAIAHFATHDYGASTALWTSLKQQSSTSELGQTIEASDWLERIAFAHRRDHP